MAIPTVNRTACSPLWPSKSQAGQPAAISGHQSCRIGSLQPTLAIQVAGRAACSPLWPSKLQAGQPAALSGYPSFRQGSLQPFLPLNCRQGSLQAPLAIQVACRLPCSPFLSSKLQTGQPEALSCYPSCRQGSLQASSLAIKLACRAACRALWPSKL